MPRPARKSSKALCQPYGQYPFCLVLACSVPMANIFISPQMNGLLSLGAKSTKPIYLPVSIWRQLSNPLTLKIHSQILPHPFFLAFSERVPFGHYPSLVWHFWWRLDCTEWRIEVPLPYDGYFPSSNRARHNVNFKWLIGDNILRNQRHPTTRHYVTNVQFTMKLLSALSSLEWRSLTASCRLFGGCSTWGLEKQRKMITGGWKHMRKRENARTTPGWFGGKVSRTHHLESDLLKGNKEKLKRWSEGWGGSGNLDTILQPMWSHRDSEPGREVVKVQF